MITDILCGRASDPPADPARGGALAALVAGELAHRVFLDAADVRIVEFIRQLHQQTGVDPHLLDAVVRGLLGAPLPAVTDPLTPLLVLGRGLVVALDLDEQAVAELVSRSEQRLSDWLPNSAAPPNPQPSTAPIPAVSPTPVPRTPVPPTPVPRRAKTPYLVGWFLAAFGVLALVVSLNLPLGASRNGQSPLPTATSAPLESDPRQLADAFAEAINKKQFDRAQVLLCSESTSLTRDIAKGQLPVEGFSVDRVRTQNSTTAYLLGKATINSKSGPLVWRGTLRTRGGNWCVLDVRPEVDSPPAQQETRDVAFEKMRNFVTLVSQSDSIKAMSYVCGTQQWSVTQTMIDTAIKTRAKLAVAPDPGPESASTYTGSVNGSSHMGTIKGNMTISRSDNGTYCISYFEIKYE